MASNLYSMKKISLLAFVFMALNSFGQGNLQFNQVLTYTGTVTGTQLSTTYTVPSGKIWKIKYCSDSRVGSCGGYNIWTGIGYGIYINSIWTIVSSNNALNDLYLKSGDTIYFGYGKHPDPLNNCPGGIVSMAYDYLISIVEFNIIP